MKLHSITADTIVKVYNSLDTQIFTFDWSPAMATVILNPDVWTICRTLGTVKQDTTLRNTLGIKNIFSGNVKIFPNPSKNYWQIDQLPNDTGLTLIDMNGNVIWLGKSNSGGGAMVPGDSLPSGNYILKVGNQDSVKLVHW